MKILVPTDFSINSLAGIHFAIHLANQTDAEIHLQFIYVNHLAKVFAVKEDPVVQTSLTEDKEQSAYQVKLEEFVLGIYNEMGIQPKRFSVEVIRGVRADSALLNYCAKTSGIDYICMSTKGADKIDRLFGTNTGNLVTKSDVPVIVVPLDYAIQPFTKIVYASDLQDFDAEIERVVNFSSALKTPIEVLHFVPDLALIPDKYNQQEVEKKYNYGITFHFEKTNPVHTLLKNLRDQLVRMKPSILVLFTKRHRSFFHKLFLSDLAEDLAFHAVVPMLVINKT
ncbi:MULTISPECIES: universal stress protein [Olivibacter]|jgi:nucleotide-binding universal stress UspA family protein|uniref:Universal stress protein n=2 Tax=Olivibacter TaxID=376469 RepID=A0ABV6HKE2_9SPHI|nr:MULTISPECIES: universal stress protein [Olivibacter]MCL4641346.1 universal stress protein [Olivibacter sp. UJ_SKK_5.1]MDX3914008.1 universal stress protein [Pseudosphingobacterium sp.]QEL02155.1 universal stress protein [Olivibacter sp. LS-1]